jgi:nucleotide-binding universal stress UspA family protein
MMAAPEVTHAHSCQSWEYERATPGIVVGVDGSRESIAALNTGAVLARRRRCPLHAVTVLSPYPSYHAIPAGDDSEHTVNELRMSLRDSELHDIVTALEPEEDWTHEVMMGRPARELNRAAVNRGADLMIVGRKRHSAMDRVLGGETTLQVMRTSTIPVLAVDTDLEIPRTVVAAVDFSPSSILAVKSALEFMSGSGTLYLVFVEPAPVIVPAGYSAPVDMRFPGDLVVWFRRMVADLGIQAGIIAEPVVLGGRPASAIVQFAERVGADMIAAGSHGHGRLERFLLGSVSSGIVRNANCAVLVVPPSS